MEKCFFIVITVGMLNANPIFTEIIHEFQVGPYDSERIEFRYFATPSVDTIYNNSIALFNTLIVTPAGSSYVDTSMHLPPYGYSVIERSVLSGPFWLPNDSGYIEVYKDTQWLPIWDSIFYPGHANMYPVHAPIPPSYCSAAKFYCYAYDSTWPLSPYGLITDWYVDSTPTFGEANDDYPGCFVSGHVYDSNGFPLLGARVTATVLEGKAVILSPPQYYKSCTTYTSDDGLYVFDSLLPWRYYVDVYADGYLPDTHLADYLCCTDPIMNLNFYLQTGILEYQTEEMTHGLHVYTNPFSQDLNIVLSESLPHVDIYDVTGKLCIRIDNRSFSNHIHIDCSFLPTGIYFVSTSEKKIKIIKF
ncbi:MAG: carboxypeptidase regulatory-like domain-containing protein [candidate division WOR-3 bacterium]|nr:MAG: carboxypeptidase regulatory-like domain-containing protein [candidate division WOR-3 bacterium]